MTDRRPRWVDSGSGPGWDARPVRPFPRLSGLRGIRPSIPAANGPDDDQVVPTREGECVPSPFPAHVEVDALKTILARHVTGADGICFCGERAGEFTGRCRSGRKAAKRLTALGFMGYEIPAPPGWKSPDG